MPYVDLHPDRGFPHAMVLLAALEASVVPTAGLSAVQLMLAVFERAGIEAHLEDFRDLEGAARIGGL